MPGFGVGARRALSVGMSTFHKIVRRHRNSGRLDTLFISTVAFVATAIIHLAV